MIPCSARNLHHIMLQIHVKTISCVAESNARFSDLDPHDIEASDVPGSISKELRSLVKMV